MKLYATITSSRGKKDGLGDDKWLEIDLQLGNKRIGRIIFDYQGGRSFSLSYEKIVNGRSSDGSKIIDSYDFDCGCEQGVYSCSSHVKEKSQCKVHDWDNYGKCCNCGKWNYIKAKKQNSKKFCNNGYPTPCEICPKDGWGNCTT